MSDVRDPKALMRHAIQAGDWRLVELIARMLSGQLSSPAPGGRRAYGTLVVMLGLADPANYHRS